MAGELESTVLCFKSLRLQGVRVEKKILKLMTKARTFFDSDQKRGHRERSFKHKDRRKKMTSIASS